MCIKLKLIKFLVIIYSMPKKMRGRTRTGSKKRGRRGAIATGIQFNGLIQIKMASGNNRMEITSKTKPFIWNSDSVDRNNSFETLISDIISRDRNKKILSDMEKSGYSIADFKYDIINRLRLMTRENNKVNEFYIQKPGVVILIKTINNAFESKSTVYNRSPPLVFNSRTQKNTPSQYPVETPRKKRTRKPFKRPSPLKMSLN
jgi:hypothetical protein